MLHEALMSLIVTKKSYDAISIKDICDAANVGRSTFYAHYTSKDDLKKSGLESIRKLVAERQQRDKSGKAGDTTLRGLGFSLTMFEHARDHVDHYRAMVGGRSSAVALDKIRQIVSDLVRDELSAAADKEFADAVHREFAVRYVVGAYMAVLTWWLDGGAKVPPERIDAMFRHLATDGIMRTRFQSRARAPQGT
jgi:AcrR family transcriptional regulator